MMDVQRWLDALNAARTIEVVAHGFTCAELSDLWGVSRKVANARLQKLHAKKMIRCTGKKQTLGVDGNYYQAPAYDVIEAP